MGRTMNIAEYIEQNMEQKSYEISVHYDYLEEDIEFEDIPIIKQQVDMDLQELYKCHFVEEGVTDAILQMGLMTEFYKTRDFVAIKFSYLIDKVRRDNPHWLSDILQQTRMNNYIVKGD